jgi:hypothetical protein
VAKLPDPVLTNIFTLQRRIIESIDTTTVLAFRLLTKWGETAETLTELGELQNIQKRLRSQYARSNTLLLKFQSLEGDSVAVTSTSKEIQEGMMKKELV